MVQEAPTMEQQVHRIKDFFGSAVILAHHAPFDLGFIGHDFEKYLKILPQNPVLCTSLLSRILIPESPNHKLQTLIKVLKIDGGTAHRALDDARACLYVGIECMKRMGENATLADLLKKQGKDLSWTNYSLNKHSEPLRTLKEAIETGKHVDIVYQGGTLKGQSREIIPFGIVRNPDGDYVQATCLIDRIDKRFYLSKITDCAIKY
jgi:DNA polymerase-3 subunit epsilon